MTKVINNDNTAVNLAKRYKNYETRSAQDLAKWVRNHGEYRSNDLTTKSDGGALVPQSVLNNAIDLTNNKFRLIDYVNRVQVKTGMGKMPILDPNEVAVEKDELDKDPELDQGLKVCQYNIKSYIGRLSYSNEFVEDNNFNVLTLLTKQLSDVICNTQNQQISKTMMDNVPAKSINNLDDLLDGLASIDPRYAKNIFMDTQSFAKVREFKDHNGRYLLNENDNTIFGMPVVVVPSYTGLKGIFIGDLKTALVYFDRLNTELQYARPGVFGGSLVCALRFDTELAVPEALVHLQFSGSSSNK